MPTLFLWPLLCAEKPLFSALLSFSIFWNSAAGSVCPACQSVGRGDTSSVADETVTAMLFLFEAVTILGPLCVPQGSSTTKDRWEEWHGGGGGAAAAGGRGGAQQCDLYVSLPRGVNEPVKSSEWRMST